ncbi:MAG: Glu/Leu/Phe/Val dehydrogenase dimerization region [Frankiales bacterium]|nr:Glu/Leu/Phe/Val dehydrogenase dimerization region [Frankiales bacterium]
MTTGFGVFDRTDQMKDAGHEQVMFCQDPQSGLRAIIAIYSTALGPALGGTRFYPYPDEAAALTDVLKLSKAMAYKAACAGVDLGGGKAVILGDPTTLKTEQLLRAYGRMVESLGGRYYTACDVGTFVQDMDVIAKETRFATGRSPEHGGAGDSAVLTAYGVFQAMRAAAQQTWGEPTLTGKRVAVEGVGKVGHHLVEHLLEDGATVVVSDVNDAALARISPAAQRATVAELPLLDVDVYAPCALGATVTDELVPELQAKIVCGAANNQLAHPGIEKELADRGILYAPDYVANAGGLIQVEDEALNDVFSFERAKAKATTIFDTTLRIFQTADAEGVPPAVAADRLAERRMAEVGRLRAVLLPGQR